MHVVLQVFLEAVAKHGGVIHGSAALSRYLPLWAQVKGDVDVLLPCEDPRSGSEPLEALLETFVGWLRDVDAALAAKVRSTIRFVHGAMYVMSVAVFGTHLADVDLVASRAARPCVPGEVVRHDGTAFEVSVLALEELEDRMRDLAVPGRPVRDTGMPPLAALPLREAASAKAALRLALLVKVRRDGEVISKPAPWCCVTFDVARVELTRVQAAVYERKTQVGAVVREVVAAGSRQQAAMLTRLQCLQDRVAECTAQLEAVMAQRKAGATCRAACAAAVEAGCRAVYARMDQFTSTVTKRVQGLEQRLAAASQGVKQLEENLTRRADVKFDEYDGLVKRVENKRLAYEDKFGSKKPLQDAYVLGADLRRLGDKVPEDVWQAAHRRLTRCLDVLGGGGMAVLPFKVSDMGVPLESDAEPLALTQVKLVVGDLLLAYVYQLLRFTQADRDVPLDAAGEAALFAKGKVHPDVLEAAIRMRASLVTLHEKLCVDSCDVKTTWAGVMEDLARVGFPMTVDTAVAAGIPVSALAFAFGTSVRKQPTALAAAVIARLAHLFSTSVTQALVGGMKDVHKAWMADAHEREVHLVKAYHHALAEVATLKDMLNDAMAALKSLTRLHFGPLFWLDDKPAARPVVARKRKGGKKK